MKFSTAAGLSLVPPGLHHCPGFGQDRVNFHQNPGGDRLTQPGQTEQGIPHHVLSCWVLAGGSWAAGRSRGSGARSRSGRWERLCAFCGLCCVFSVSVSLLFLFPMFAVLLNCPNPDPPVFLPVSFHSVPHPSGGRGGRVAAWPFCCWPQPNYNNHPPQKAGRILLYWTVWKGWGGWSEQRWLSYCTSLAASPSGRHGGVHGCKTRPSGEQEVTGTCYSSPSVQ